MQAAITGASGLLGGNLAKHLVESGWSVRATKRGSSKVEHLADLAGIDWRDADLDDTSKLTEAFRGCDVVFHCAAVVGIARKPTPAMRKGNVDGTKNVIEAVKRGGAKRLVHCSTVAVVGLSTDGNPCTEESPYNFDQRGLVDGYGATKRVSEQIVRDAVKEGLDAVIANPCFMFGPLDAKPSSGRLIVDVARGKMPGLLPGKNNFVDVRDVARGMRLVAEKGRRGERYILGGENVTYEEITQRIARLAGTKPPTWRIPRALSAPAGWFGDLMELVGGDPLVTSVTLGFGYCPDFIFSSEKAKRELGYETRSVDEGIRDAIGWFRGKGMMS